MKIRKLISILCLNILFGLVLHAQTLEDGIGASIYLAPLDGKLVIGEDNAGISKLKVSGSNQVDLAINALSGISDFTMQIQGQTKSQFKYAQNKGFSFEVNQNNTGGGGIGVAYTAMFIDGFSQYIGMGLGINSPDSRLHILDENNILKIETSGTVGVIDFSDAGGQISRIGLDNDDFVLGTVSGEAGNVIIETGGAERLIVDDAGNVGIGRTPLYPLHVKGTSAQMSRFETSSNFNYTSYHNSSGYVGYIGVYNGLNDMEIGTRFGSTGKTHLVTQTAPRLTVDKDGFVGIGTENPDEGLLHLEGQTSSLKSGIYSKINYVGNSDVAAIEAISKTNDGYGIGIRARGSYRGINVSTNEFNTENNPFACYGVHSSANGTGGTLYGIYGTSSGTGATNYAGYFAGDATVTGTFNNPSDRKLKKDIKLYENGLEKIRALKTKSYTYKVNEYEYMRLSDKKQIGFIAQEVEEVLPELVSENVQPEEVKFDDDGGRILIKDAINYKAINYIGLIPVLTQGIQELDKNTTEEILALKKENENLKSELEEIKSLIQEMNIKFSQNQKDSPQNELNVELNGNTKLPFIKQNAPNPFKDQTVIEYFVPSDAGKSIISFMDINGKILKSINLDQKGQGQIILSAEELVNGVYYYSLIIDDKKVETKQMIHIQ